MKLKSIIAALVGCIGLAVALAAPAAATNATPNVYGKSIGNWGHAWWQWAANFPLSTNPIAQQGEVDCSAGQSGKVWFLAGTFGGAAERTCTINQGRALFFPILNVLAWFPEDCKDIASCRALSASIIDPLSSWTCSIDGVPCVFRNQAVRDQSSPLPFTIAPNSYLTEPGFGDYEPGLRAFAIADGLWVMLPPLPVGTHTLRFTANAGSFGLDVKYTLHVVP